MHSFSTLSSIWKTDIPKQEMYRFYQCFTKPLLNKRRHQRKQFVKSVQQKQTQKCTQLSTGNCNPSPRLHDWGSEVPVCRIPLESLSACKWQPQLTYCQHKCSTDTQQLNIHKVEIHLLTVTKTCKLCIQTLQKNFCLFPLLFLPLPGQWDTCQT